MPCVNVQVICVFYFVKFNSSGRTGRRAGEPATVLPGLLKIVSIENSLRNQTHHAYNSQKWTTITLQDYTYSTDWDFNLFLRVLWTNALFLEISKRIYFRTYRDYRITNSIPVTFTTTNKQTI